MDCYNIQKNYNHRRALSTCRPFSVNNDHRYPPQYPDGYIAMGWQTDTRQRQTVQISVSFGTRYDKVYVILAGAGVHKNILILTKKNQVSKPTSLTSFWTGLLL